MFSSPVLMEQSLVLPGLPAILKLVKPLFLLVELLSPLLSIFLTFS